MIPMLYMNCGAVFILAGFAMFYFPPRNINWTIGYRTRRSMKNKETWDFAQNYCGKILYKLGAVLLILGICVSLLDLDHPSVLIVGLIFFVAALIGMILHIESVLKRHFP